MVSGDIPTTCSNCRKIGEKCSFSRIPQKRGPSKGYTRENVEYVTYRNYNHHHQNGNEKEKGNDIDNGNGNNQDHDNAIENGRRRSKSFLESYAVVPPIATPLKTSPSSVPASPYVLPPINTITSSPATNSMMHAISHARSFSSTSTTKSHSTYKSPDGQLQPESRPRATSSLLPILNPIDSSPAVGPHLTPTTTISNLSTLLQPTTNNGITQQQSLSQPNIPGMGMSGMFWKVPNESHFKDSESSTSASSSSARDQSRPRITIVPKTHRSGSNNSINFDNSSQFQGNSNGRRNNPIPVTGVSGSGQNYSYFFQAPPSGYESSIVDDYSDNESNGSISNYGGSALNSPRSLYGSFVDSPSRRGSRNSSISFSSFGSNTNSVINLPGLNSNSNLSIGPLNNALIPSTFDSSRRAVSPSLSVLSLASLTSNTRGLNLQQSNISQVSNSTTGYTLINNNILPSTNNTNTIINPTNISNSKDLTQFLEQILKILKDENYLDIYYQYIIDENLSWPILPSNRMDLFQLLRNVCNITNVNQQQQIFNNSEKGLLISCFIQALKIRITTLNINSTNHNEVENIDLFQLLKQISDLWVSLKIKLQTIDNEQNEIDVISIKTLLMMTLLLIIDSGLNSDNISISEIAIIIGISNDMEFHRVKKKKIHKIIDEDEKYENFIASTNIKLYFILYNLQSLKCFMNGIPRMIPCMNLKVNQIPNIVKSFTIQKKNDVGINDNSMMIDDDYNHGKNDTIIFEIGNILDNIMTCLGGSATIDLGLSNIKDDESTSNDIRHLKNDAEWITQEITIFDSKYINDNNNEHVLAIISSRFLHLFLSLFETECKFNEILEMLNSRCQSLNINLQLTYRNGSNFNDNNNTESSNFMEDEEIDELIQDCIMNIGKMGRKLLLSSKLVLESIFPNNNNTSHQILFPKSYLFPMIISLIIISLTLLISFISSNEFLHHRKAHIVIEAKNCLKTIENNLNNNDNSIIWHKKCLKRLNEMKRKDVTDIDGDEKGNRNEIYRKDKQEIIKLYHLLKNGLNDLRDVRNFGWMSDL